MNIIVYIINFFLRISTNTSIFCEKSLVKSKNREMAFEWHSSYQIKTMNQNIYSRYFSIFLYYKKPFLPILNDLILSLMSGGIFDHWSEIHNKYSTDFKLARNNNQQVLTMDFMTNLILICSIPLILSLIAFGFEIKLKIVTNRRSEEMSNSQEWLD